MDDQNLVIENTEETKPSTKFVTMEERDMKKVTAKQKIVKISHPNCQTFQ